MQACRYSLKLSTRVQMADPPRIWNCPHRAIPSSKQGYCIFHEPLDSKPREVDIVSALKKYITSCLSKQVPIVLHGFQINANFSLNRVLISQPILCQDASFEDLVITGVECSNRVVFDKCTFGFLNASRWSLSKDTRFFECSFKEGFHFKSCVVSGFSQFFDMDVNESFWLSGCYFTGSTLFDNIHAYGKCNLEANRFECHHAKIELSCRNIDDAPSNIHGQDEVDIRGNSFLGVSYLELTMRFQNKETNIYGNVFEPEHLYFEIEAPSITVLGNNVFFPKRGTIKGDFSQLLLRGNTLSNLQFGKTTWPIKKPFGMSFLSGRSVCYEELTATKRHEWARAQSTYRQLQPILKASGYDSVGRDFHYGEMECKRKQMSRMPGTLYAILFKWSCGYGDRPLRVISGALLIILLASVFYLYAGISYNNILIDYDLAFKFSPTGFSDFIKCLYLSIITFTTLGFGDVVASSDWGRIVTGLEALVGALYMALLIFVFGRRT